MKSDASPTEKTILSAFDALLVELASVIGADGVARVVGTYQSALRNSRTGGNEVPGEDIYADTVRAHRIEFGIKDWSCSCGAHGTATPLYGPWSARGRANSHLDAQIEAALMLARKAME